MPTKIDPVGMRDIADMLDGRLAYGTIAQYHKTGKMPEPDRLVNGRTPVWDRKRIQRWIDTR